MLLTIVAVGSRGDVQPLVALGTGLARAGYRVRIATHHEHSPLVVKHGLEFAAIEGNPRELLQSATGQEWLASGKSPVAFYRGLRRMADQTLEQSLADSVEACRGSDAIVYSILGGAGYHVAEQLGVPRFLGLIVPFSRTREFPAFLMPRLPLGGTYNWWTHVLSEQLLWQLSRKNVNRWRRESLNLTPIPFAGRFKAMYDGREPYLYAFSRHVIPPPRDWPDTHHVTGYWFLDPDAEWQPPAELVDFLSSGQKPIYVGFGSMTGRTVRELIDVALEAVTLAKQRAVLVHGWAEATDRRLPEHVYALQYAPHEWLFPRVAAVVHHGGAGTTGAGLRAGVPSVITPFFADQPFWGCRVHALGVGTKPILRQRLTAQQLAEAINVATSSEAMRRCAASLGEKIRAEDGVARAVDVIGSHLR